MDNIGDWIYWVVIAAITLSGLLKGKKQKQPSSAPTPVAKKAEETPRPVVQQVNEKVFVGKQFADFDHNAIPDDEPELMEIKEEPHAPTLDIQNAEEIRKAVIYSEILKRRG